METTVTQESRSLVAFGVESSLPSARMRSEGYGSRTVCVCVCVCVSRPLICDSRN